MSGTEKFSAAASMVGYVYQCEYALYRALDTDDPAQFLMVETFDDVVAEGKDALELLQLKHHDTANSKPFTDASTDLWKTIRIWSSLIADGSVDPSKTRFLLLTTSQASENASLVAYLAPRTAVDSKRNVTEAKKRLRSIADAMYAGSNETAKKNVSPFLALSATDFDLLISNMTIVPGIEVIDGLRKKIMDRLMFSGASVGDLSNFTKSLLGWWYWVVVETLRSETNKSISKEQLQEQISSLVARYAVSTLPIFEDINEPNADEDANLRTRTFVKQMQAIGFDLEKQAVAGALVDYYRADGHIKRWVQDLRLHPKELKTFRDDLRGHWSMSFGAIEPEAELCVDPVSSDRELASLGRKAFTGSVTGNPAVLKNLSADYLRRGVLHIMANEPIIGWHPHWAKMFKVEN